MRLIAKDKMGKFNYRRIIVRSFKYFLIGTVVSSSLMFVGCNRSGDSDLVDTPIKEEENVVSNNQELAVDLESTLEDTNSDSSEKIEETTQVEAEEMVTESIATEDTKTEEIKVEPEEKKQTKPVKKEEINSTTKPESVETVPVIKPVESKPQTEKPKQAAETKPKQIERVPNSGNAFENDPYKIAKGTAKITEASNLAPEQKEIIERALEKQRFFHTQFFKNKTYNKLNVRSEDPVEGAMYIADTAKMEMIAMLEETGIMTPEIELAIKELITLNSEIGMYAYYMAKDGGHSTLIEFINSSTLESNTYIMIKNIFATMHLELSKLLK